MRWPFKINLMCSIARLSAFSYLACLACSKPNNATLEVPNLVVRSGARTSLESNIVLDFGDQKDELAISLFNTGGGTLTWRSITTEPWISLVDGNGEFAETGMVSAAESITIRVRLNRETAPANPDTAYIEFTSGSQDPIPVAVVVDIVPGTLLLSPDVLNFLVNSRNSTMVVRNPGDKPVTWKLQSVPPWLSIADEQAGYETSSSSPTELRIQVDRSQIDFQQPGTDK